MTRIEEGCEVLIISGGKLPRNVGRSGIAEKYLHPGDKVTLSSGQVLPYQGRYPAWFVSCTSKKLDALYRTSDGEQVAKGADWAIYREDALMCIDDYEPEDIWEESEDRTIIQLMKMGAKRK